MNLSRLTIFFSQPWSWFLAVYFLALLMSWTLTLALDKPEYLHKHQRLLTTETDGEQRTLSYYHFQPAQNLLTLPVVMLHDNLYQAEALTPLAKHLSDRGFEVIVPDYPGYGFSNDRYGFRLDEKAESVEKVLNELDISEFHLLGHGLGGAVTFYLADQGNLEPASVVLISAKGVLDLNLLGNHMLNRVLLFLQFPAYWFVDNLTPHFGWLYQTLVNDSAIKSAYEMDLRPVRDMMLEFEKPAFILHGRGDRYVTKMTAKEHHRILPQSEIEILDGNQRIFRDQAEPISQHLATFFNKVESGGALTRSDSPNDRVEASREPFDPDRAVPLAGLSLILFLALLALITFVSEDLACIGAGLLVAKGVLNFLPAVAACFTGILLADVTIYWLGRLIGTPMLNWIPFRWMIHEDDVRKAEDVFRESGLIIIFVSRFIPGTRFPTYFSTGMIKASFTLFLFYFLLAILIWTPFLVGISMLIGHQILDYFYYYQDYAIWIFSGLVLLIFIGIKVILPLATQSGRRAMKVKLERFKRRFF